MMWTDWPGTTAPGFDLLVQGHCPAQFLGSAERRFSVPSQPGIFRALPPSSVKPGRRPPRSGAKRALRSLAAAPCSGRSGVQHAPTQNSVEAIVFITRSSKWKKTGQLRPYVRPVMRHLPLAIMGVRLRVRHQSVGRAQGTWLLSVLPKLYVLDYRFSHHAVQRFLPVRRAFARRPPSTGLSRHNFRCSYDAPLCVVDLVARHQRPCDARYFIRQCTVTSLKGRRWSRLSVQTVKSLAIVTP